MHEPIAVRAASLPPSEVQRPATAWETRLHKAQEAALAGTLNSNFLNLGFASKVTN